MEWIPLLLGWVVWYNRCLYVVEVQGCLQVTEDLQRGDIIIWQIACTLIHYGLRDLYEQVFSTGLPGGIYEKEDIVLGREWRGFYGCTINLVKEQDIESFVLHTKAYKKACIKPQIYIC